MIRDAIRSNTFSDLLNNIEKALLVNRGKYIPLYKSQKILFSETCKHERYPTIAD
jgi:hypothetical protein